MTLSKIRFSATRPCWLHKNSTQRSWPMNTAMLMIWFSASRACSQRKATKPSIVVRELRCKRVWFAESLIASSSAEVRRLIIHARQWAQRLGLPVRLWISDKRKAFVKGIRKEFPGVASEMLSTTASSCEKPAPRKNSPSYCKTSNSDTMTHHSLLADH